MDPLSALGIAAAVVQFVDYATKRCRAVQKLYETGETAMLKGISFKNVAVDLVDFSVDFRKRQRLDPSGSGSNEHTDEAIDQLVTGCSDVAQELAGMFRKLEQIKHDDHLLSKVITFMRAAWEYDDITRLMEKMAAYQSQLTLRMLQHLSITTGDIGKSQTQRFDSLDRQYSKIIQIMAVTEDRLDKLGGQNATLRQRLDSTETRGIAQHDKILSAILTLQNGETRVIAPKGTYQQSSDGVTQSVIKLRAEKNNTVGSAQLQGFEPIQDMVLRSLYFRHYSDRYDSVKQAHESTFNWLLTPEPDEPDPVPHDRQIADQPIQPHPWTPLLPWLESGSGCYWINGKAGSGKSTLMKYLLNDPRTKQALRKWTDASGSTATVASFFFWNLGTNFQKSQEGLLRSILYDILRQHPGLIPTVMPELRILGADVSRSNVLDSPTLAELVRWLLRLANQTSSEFRLFFIIDGIDEYEGRDHVEIVNLLSSISTYPFVKCLLSSRPLPVCVDAFSGFPNLKLQDLTRKDIQSYTEDILREKLKSRHGNEWESLVNAIVEKSCGVFLWVVVVVRSLLAGLQNYDDISELRSRLDEFPLEIKDLYAAMFKRMAEKYRKQASELFQVCLIAYEAQKGEHHLTPLQLHFTNSNTASVLQMPVKVLNIDKEKEVEALMEGRIRARCAGILELRSVDFRMEGLMSSKLIKHVYVDFIHRTAVEFLRLPEVWDEMFSLTAGTDFHPAVSLCHSCVAICKTSARESPLVLDESQIWYYMDRAMHYASIAERDGHPVSPSVLQDLDSTMSTHWKSVDTCYKTRQAFEAARRSKSGHWRFNGEAYCDTHGSHWTSAYDLTWNDGSLDDGMPPLRDLLRGAAKPFDFHSMAVFYCLGNFLQHMPVGPSRPGRDMGDSASRLLFDATNNMLFRRPWPGRQEDREAMALCCPMICSILLDQGASPNVRFGISDETAWELMLEYGVLHRSRNVEFWRNFDNRGFAYTFTKLLVNFVQHGANVNAEIESKTRPGFIAGSYRPTFSALGAIDALYSPARSTNPFAISSQSLQDPGTRSEELILLYDHLVAMMIQNGAAREPGSRGRTSDGTTSQSTRTSKSNMLMPPERPKRPKSAEILKDKIGNMFGKWQKNTKGSMES